jgi:hypothetical protein
VYFGCTEIEQIYHGRRGFPLGVRLKIDFLRTAPTREFIRIGLSGTAGVV